MPLDSATHRARHGAAERPVADQRGGFYNPERRSAVNIVPGLIGVILTMTMVLFTGVAIVRERERGNMELLIATPVSRSELMIGKVLPYAAIGLVQTTRGAAARAAGCSTCRCAAALLDVYLAAVLLIARQPDARPADLDASAQSQFQAMQMTFFVFLPSILLSGFMFPFAGMPQAVQWLAEVLPLTHFLRLIRGVMLRGATLARAVAGRAGAAGLHRGDDDRSRSCASASASIRESPWLPVWPAPGSPTLRKRAVPPATQNAQFHAFLRPNRNGTPRKAVLFSAPTVAPGHGQGDRTR